MATDCLTDRMLERASALYAERKVAKNVEYAAKNLAIASDQVLALLEVCAEEIEKVQFRIASLEFENSRREDRDREEAGYQRWLAHGG